MTATTRLPRSLPLLYLVVGLFSSSPSAVSAGFLTNYAVLVNESRGYITNAYGPITAKVSPGAKALTVQFKIVAVSRSYGAGIVTATTNAQGQVTHLAKGAQNCSLAYNSTGFVRKVTCSTAPRRRLLGKSSPPESEVSEALEFDEVAGYEVAKDGEEEGEKGATGGGDPLISRQLAACSPCDTLVIGAFTTKIKALCDKAFPAKVPTQYLWAKNAAASLCRMTAKLGTPSSVAKKTCRCCTQNKDCASRTCSVGVCLPKKIALGGACPDAELDDCDRTVCARNAYPNGNYVCCPSLNSAYSPTTGDEYCSESQGTGALCGDVDEICSSGVCSEGKCLSEIIEVGGLCPDNDGNDCASLGCAKGSYPDGDYVCCPTFSTTWSVTTSTSYCEGIQGDGLFCETNAICASRVCSENKCLPQGIESGQACPEKDLFDCASGFCEPFPYPDGPYTCCNATLFTGPDGVNHVACYDHPAGSNCFANGMCSSGVCSQGHCLAQKLAVGEACPDRDWDDCESGVCAWDRPDDFVCCNGTYVVVHSGGGGDVTFPGKLYCAGRGTGSWCGTNEMCSSGNCTAGVCIA